MSFPMTVTHHVHGVKNQGKPKTKYIEATDRDISDFLRVGYTRLSDRCLTKDRKIQGRMVTTYVRW